jgi:transposase
MTNVSDVRIFFCTTPTDMKYSFDRLLGRAQEVFAQNPLDGHLFLFVNRNRDHLKLLFWDRDGYCIWHKRLERGTFQLLTVADAAGIELSYAQLVRLLGGFDLTTGRRRKRYRRPA